MRDNSWMDRRNRGLHVTIRDVDCRDFDVERFIADLTDWRVSFFSYFVGGYVTTYPTKLKYQRESPWLGGRDLAGEINDAAHRAGIRTIGMVDLAQIPANAAADHPEWCAWDERGRPVETTTPGIFTACPLGGFQNDYVREILREMLGRYDLDCMKFGGGSFGFSRPACHCPSCQESFGAPIPPPAEWDEAFRRRYTAWRFEQARQRAGKLAEYVHAVAPTMPVMGNGVCFGDPDWTLRSAMDIEQIADVMDAVQVEVQSRYRYDLATDRGEWQWLAWPMETARYMTAVTEKPIWVVASYFLAWPWRRSAVPAAEQKVYLAQIAANGASPMVNLSGGPPAVHEDPRGFPAIRELYRFLEKHNACYEGDTSAATVAVVYSLDTLASASTRGEQGDYLASIRGVERSLLDAHVPFDIISTKTLERSGVAERYAALVLPATSCLSDRAAEAVRAFAARGGGLVASFDAGRRDETGAERAGLALGEAFGVRATGAPRGVLTAADRGAQQAYMLVRGQHPIVAGAGEARLLPCGGPYLPVEPVAGAVVPLVLSAPFAVFPEGLSYPTRPDPADAMAVVGDGAARTVYFAGPVERLFWKARIPDLGRLVADAVRWVARGLVAVEVAAPPTLQVSVRRQPGRRIVHLVNLTAGERLFTSLIPLADVRLSLPAEGERAPASARALAAGASLPVTVLDGRWEVTVPRVEDYEVLVFE
jgi:hypothetical protein